MKTKFLFINLLLYLISVIIYIISDFSTGKLVQNIVFLLPLIICITFKYDVPALFISILLGCSFILIDSYGLVAYIINRYESVFDLMFIIIEILYYIIVIILSIQILLNKKRINNKLYLIVCICFILVYGVSFILDKNPYNVEKIFLFITNILFNIHLSVYLYFFESKEIVIFK